MNVNRTSPISTNEYHVVQARPQSIYTPSEMPADPSEKSLKIKAEMLANQALGRDAVRTVVDSDPLAWKKDGKCAGTDPEAFYPTDGKGVEAAQAICNLCIVKEECLEYALINNEKFGVWGGASERERRRLRRRRALSRRGIAK